MSGERPRGWKRRRKLREVVVHLEPPRTDPDDASDRAGAGRRHDEWAWLRMELRFLWREAEREAALAYDQWRLMRDRVSYAVYRAAQDRADAAQDALQEIDAAGHAWPGFAA